MTPDALKPTLQRIERTLAAGNHLWIVGEPTFWQATTDPPVLTAAPDPQAGWSCQMYYEGWTMQASHFIVGHAERGKTIEIPVGQPVNSVEECGLALIEGWNAEGNQPGRPTR